MKLHYDLEVELTDLEDNFKIGDQGFGFSNAFIGKGKVGRENRFWLGNKSRVLEHENFDVSLDVQVEYQISSWIYKPEAQGNVRGIYILDSSAYR